MRTRLTDALKTSEGVLGVSRSVPKEGDVPGGICSSDVWALAACSPQHADHAEVGRRRRDGRNCLHHRIFPSEARSLREPRSRACVRPNPFLRSIIDESLLDEMADQLRSPKACRKLRETPIGNDLRLARRWYLKMISQVPRRRPIVTIPRAH